MGVLPDPLVHDPAVQRNFDAIEAALPAGSLTACRVTTTANQTIGNFSDTSIAFDAEVWDTGSMHSTTTNNTRLTATRAGVYLVVGNIRWASVGADTRSLWIALTGNQIARVGVQNVEDMEVSTITRMSVGDYVELKVRQNSAGSVDVTLTGTRSPIFAAAYLGSI